MRSTAFLLVLNSIQKSRYLHHSTPNIVNVNIVRNLSNTDMSKKDSTTATSIPTEDDVIIQNIGNKGVITLNRPKALNSLNLSMVKKIYPVLKSWEGDKMLVIVKGAGDKAFCAGGDVKAVAEAAIKGEKLGREFFKHEYTNNGLIGTYAKPYIALIDGITMGGGVGLSVHGKYRIATERTLFAMPETQIGLFPDVGGSYFLPKLKGRLGWYLALTGYRLKGADVFKAGIATHYVPSSKLNELESALIQLENVSDLESTIAKFHVNDNTEFSLQPHLEKINKIFNVQSVEEIFKNLEQDGSEWALNTLQLLNKMSPTSLKITMKELEIGQKLNLFECLKMEYRLAVNCVENHDFKEGVRALLIDKDQSPKWKPPTIAEVTNDIVDKFFEKVPEDLEFKHKL